MMELLFQEHIKTVVLSEKKSEEAYLERKQMMRRGKRRQLNSQSLGPFTEEYTVVANSLIHLKSEWYISNVTNNKHYKL